MKRQSGILLPIFSLPSKFGIGSFGLEAYEFIDYLKSAKQSVWQILPLVQTGYGNSPYSSVCSYSFNPYFISLDLLLKDGLIDKKDLKTAEYDGKYIDYGFLFNVRYPILRKAFSRFNKESLAFKKFVKTGEFRDYALFSAIKIKTNYLPLVEWENGLKYRDENTLKQFEKQNKDEVLFWYFLQYLAKKQWNDLKKYANKQGVSIMGDMPLYVALDSVDVWQNPELFKLDEKFIPKKVAGVPPDYFCEKGQLWGNPVYDYEKHLETDFAWWKNRLKRALNTYDFVRIDHFRGLDRYYEIDSNAVDAVNGEWVEVPSVELFNAIHSEIDRDRIIAEDLGIIDDGVRELLEFTAYPGMKILSFAFNGETGNLYLPERINENSVCYTGTHDNDTLLGLVENANEWDLGNLYRGVNNSLAYYNSKKRATDKFSLIESIIELGFTCKANWFIIPMQDAISLGADYRINEPGSVKEQNWAIRLEKRHFKKSVANTLALLTEKSFRI